MHKIKLTNGKEFGVTFVHTPDAYIDQVNDELVYIPANTECMIMENESLFSHGSAWCHENDMFDRKIGRKISFGRAISNFSVEERTEFWKWFLSTFKYK